MEEFVVHQTYVTVVALHTWVIAVKHVSHSFVYNNDFANAMITLLSCSC